MALRDWPVRRMQRLWVGTAVLYGLFFLAGPVQNYRERRIVERQQAEDRAREDSAWAAMSPAQQAKADSLKDSLRVMLGGLRQAFESAASTPEFRQSVAAFGDGLWRAVVIAYALILTPALILAVLTGVWWVQRRGISAEVGA